MVNLYLNHKTHQQPGGFLANRLGSNQTVSAQSATSAAVIDRSLNSQGVAGLLGDMGGYVLAAPVEVLDSVAALFPGVEKGQINHGVWNAIGQPGFAAWVKQHEEGVEVAGGILGAITVGLAAETAAVKIAGSGWLAATGVGRAIQPMLTMTQRAEQAAKAAMTTAAQSGKSIGYFDSALPGLTKLTPRGQYVTVKTGEMMLKATVSEAAIIATMNQNDAIWSDDMTQNAIFAGLGIGVGGALGAIQGRSAMAKWANSPTVRAANAAYTDPAGFQAAADEAIKRGLDAGLAGGDRLQPKQSSIITAMMLNAMNQDTVPGVGARSGIQTQWEGEVRRSVAMMGKQGSAGLTGSGLSSNSTEYANIMQSLYKDPGTLYGASSVAKVTLGKTHNEIMSERMAFINGLKTSTTVGQQVPPSQLKMAQALESEQPMYLVNGSWVAPQEADEFLQFQPGRVRPQPTKNTGELTWKGTTGAKFVLREDGALNRPFEQLSLPDVLETREVMSGLIDKGIKMGQALPVTNKMSWAQLDMAAEYVNRGGELDYTKGPYKTLEEIKLAAIQLKVKAIGSADLDFATRVKFNLPLSTAYERITDPAGAELKHIMNAAGAQGVTYNDLQIMRVQLNQTMDLLSSAKVTDALDGDAFNFNRSIQPNSKGAWLNPVLGFFENQNVNTWTKFDLGQDIAESTVAKLNVLKSHTRTAPTVSTLTRLITDNPNLYRTISNVAELSDDQIAGTKSIVGASTNQFLTKAHIARNNQMLLAAQTLDRMVKRFVETKVDDTLKGMTQYIDAMSAASGTKSRVLYNQYLSWSNGWDIARAEQGQDGLWRFVLRDDSKHNADRLGRAVSKGEYMTNAKGQEIVLDDLGNAFRGAHEQATAGIMKEVNVLRIARGLEPVNVKPFWTPPRSTKGKFVGFTFDSNNRAVPGGAVIADSPEEFARQAEEIKKNLPKGHKFWNQDEVKAAVDIWDSAGMDFIDPHSLVRPNKSSRGALASSQINAHAMEDALAYIKTGYEQVGHGTVRTIFDSQLKSAGVHAAAVKNATMGQKAGAMTPKNIFEIFQETLLGIPSHADARGLASLANKSDEILDAALARIWPTASAMPRFVKDISNRAGVKLGKDDVASFDALAAALGPHTPFADALEFATYKANIAPPPGGKDVARHMNRLGAGVLLRWGEVVHSLMNVAGIATNMPAIIGARNVPSIGTVKGVNIPDTMKIMANGIKRMHSPASRRDWAMMIRNGDASQDVAELHHQSSMMRGKSGAMRVLTGDPKYADWRSLPKGSMARTQAWMRFKGIEGMASVMTDSSENWSRQVSHFIGLQLADYHGITGMEARHNFARQIANDAIANYDPLNRPEIYQSAFGNMYGLFLSYAQNWYQRMFRYMEDGDYKAMGRGLGMQAALFGMQGLPGFKGVAALLGGEETEEGGLVDGIYQRFGPAVGSVVANGGLNQLTYLLSLGNLPAVALHSRGDMNFRHPAMDFMGNGTIPKPVGLEVLSDIVGGAIEAIGKMNTPGMTGHHAAEIIARNMPSRMIRGAISTLALEGQEADGYGNLMSTIQTDAEAFYRMLGVRSARQAGEIEAYFMNQKAKDIQAGKMADLREKSRALIRANEMDRLPETFQAYVDNGGAPWEYRNWMQGIIRDATRTRGETQLLQSLKSPQSKFLATRLQLYTGYDAQ